MLEILKFIFSSFWIFIGVIILIATSGAAISMPIDAFAAIFINPKEKETKKEEKDNNPIEYMNSQDD